MMHISTSSLSDTHRHTHAHAPRQSEQRERKSSRLDRARTATTVHVFHPPTYTELTKLRPNSQPAEAAAATIAARGLYHHHVNEVCHPCFR